MAVCPKGLGVGVHARSESAPSPGQVPRGEERDTPRTIWRNVPIDHRGVSHIASVDALASNSLLDGTACRPVGAYCIFDTEILV